MSRRKRRRRTKPGAEPALAPRADTPVNWSRLRQIFSNLSHRGTPLFRDYVLSPVVVDAKNPEDAAALSDLAIVAITKTLPPN